MADKANVLLVGCGGVGAIAALNLERGSKATVTAVLRSSYQKVRKDGFMIESCDHGTLHHWLPSKVVSTIPTISQNEEPVEFVVIASKNVPDSENNLAKLIAPAVTPGFTIIVLIQNGLNIELPFFSRFPENVVLSGISMIGSQELEPGVIDHSSMDDLLIGPFRNPNIPSDVEDQAAHRFISIYMAGGKTSCNFTPDVGWNRWRKLVYNACMNPVCAITGLDTGNIMLAGAATQSVIRNAMEEIRVAAQTSGYLLPVDIVEEMMSLDPPGYHFSPSMLQDVRKYTQLNLIEHEYLLGEPLREGLRLGVPMPTISVLYGLCTAVQWRIKYERAQSRQSS